MVEKIALELNVDVSAVKEATAALDALAAASDRAKTALDALFWKPETFIHVPSDSEDEMVFGLGKWR